MAVETKIVPLESSQHAVASDVLARAFFDDALTVWVLPDDDHRRRALNWFMGTGARYAMKFGHVDTTAATFAAPAAGSRPARPTPA